jgi:hypothetical protein
MEELASSPVGGIIDNAVPLARPALALGTAAIASGASAGTGLAIAGSVVAGLGIVDWFRKLGTAKVNDNLEALGQATEESLNRVERVLLEQGTSVDEIKARIESQEFKDAMASASLQALRTTQKDRLKRIALILANGVKEDDLDPERLDDMMRAAVELTSWDIRLLDDLYEAKASGSVQETFDGLFSFWQAYWVRFADRNPGRFPRSTRGSFGRLASLGLLSPDHPTALHGNPVSSLYWITNDGIRFHERLQEIAVEPVGVILPS